MFLSEVKHLLMSNVQLCLIFERFYVTLKFPLHRVGYGYDSFKAFSLVQ